MGLIPAEWILPCVMLATYFGLAAVADRRSDVVRRVLVSLTVILTLRFAWWRTWNTMPPWGFSLESVVALVLLVLELLVINSALRDLWPHRKMKRRLREVDESLGWYGSKPPLIDVLIPTYNEPLAVLERTIACCQGIDYPRYRVWLLDDGKRDHVERFAAEQGVNYLRRETNEHFKAGNLNHGVRHIMRLAERPEFFAVLDADFMPRAAFLERTLALMKPSDVGLVQTPQCFFNPDPIQYAFDDFIQLPDEQRYFFDEKQIALDSAGSAFCCGTSFLVRASALLDAGGFPTESVTEDVLTTLSLRSRGYRTVYLHEHLTTGLAPEGLGEYLTQRGRWCLGHVQITQSSFGALRRRGGFFGRLRYALDSTEWAMHGIVQVVYLVLPAIYVLTGFTPITAPFEELTIYVVPLVLQQFAWAWATGGLVVPIFFEGVRLIALSAVLKATAGAVLFPNRKVKFAVTDKGRSRQRTVFHAGAAAWFLVPMSVLLGAYVDMAFDAQALSRAQDLGIWFWVWTLSSLLVLVIALWPCFERPKFRADERHPSGLEARFRLAGRETTVVIRDVSVGGALLEAEPAPVRGDVCELFVAGVGWLPGTVVRSDGRLAGVHFTHEGSSRAELIRALYSRSPPQRPRDYSARAMARTVFGRVSTRAWSFARYVVLGATESEPRAASRATS